MEAIILAGGLGTRLNSRIPGLPKPMAPIAGRPFLEILLDALVGAGCSRVILSVGHLRDVIINHFGESYRGVPVRYVVEETPLGTGGAIRNALQEASEAAVFVLNGDTYLDVDYAQMYAAHAALGGSMTIAVALVNEMARYGGVAIDGDCATGFIEKGRTGPGWINAGVYALESDFPWPDNLPARFSFETDVLAACVTQLRPAVFRCRGQFLDIGTPEDLDRAQTELTARARPD
jgi:D-glycero-alpha-D-manno-heptose 1-phosphate guanylyltransferase